MLNKLEHYPSVEEFLLAERKRRGIYKRSNDAYTEEEMEGICKDERKDN